MDLQALIDQATAVSAAVITSWGQAQVATTNAQVQPPPVTNQSLSGSLAGNNNSAMLLIGGIALIGLMLALKK